MFVFDTKLTREQQLHFGVPRPHKIRAVSMVSCNPTVQNKRRRERKRGSPFPDQQSAPYRAKKIIKARGVYTNSTNMIAEFWSRWEFMLLSSMIWNVWVTHAWNPMKTTIFSSHFSNSSLFLAPCVWPYHCNLALLLSWPYGFQYLSWMTSHVQDRYKGSCSQQCTPV